MFEVHLSYNMSFQVLIPNHIKDYCLLPYCLSTAAQLKRKFSTGCLVTLWSEGKVFPYKSLPQHKVSKSPASVHGGDPCLGLVTAHGPHDIMQWSSTCKGRWLLSAFHNQKLLPSFRSYLPTSVSPPLPSPLTPEHQADFGNLHVISFGFCFCFVMS